MKITVGGFDWETTGFVEPEHRIIEACLKTWAFDTDDPLNPTLLDKYVQRIDPQRSVPKKAFEVHKIAESDLVGCPTFEEIAPTLYTKLDALDLGVAHNGLDFDVPFVIQEFDRVGHPLPDFEPFDTMVDGRWATAFGEVPSLKKLCFACGVEYIPEEAHAAEYDVDKMMECFFYGVANGYYKI